MRIRGLSRDNVNCTAMSSAVHTRTRCLGNLLCSPSLPSRDEQLCPAFGPSGAFMRRNVHTDRDNVTPVDKVAPKVLYLRGQFFILVKLLVGVDFEDLYTSRR